MFYISGLEKDTENVRAKEPGQGKAWKGLEVHSRAREGPLVISGRL